MPRRSNSGRLFASWRRTQHTLQQEDSPGGSHLPTGLMPGHHQAHSQPDASRRQHQERLLRATCQGRRGGDHETRQILKDELVEQARFKKGVLRKKQFSLSRQIIGSLLAVFGGWMSTKVTRQTTTIARGSSPANSKPTTIPERRTLLQPRRWKHCEQCWASLSGALATTRRSLTHCHRTGAK